MPDEHHPYNPVCPHCGKKDTLRATVACTAVDIPLFDDGYCVLDGFFEGEQITRIVCRSCQQEVSIGYYYNEPPAENDQELCPDEDEEDVEY